MKKPLLPPALLPGNLIAVAAPSGPVRKKDFLRGVDHLAGRGFRVTYREDIFSRETYLAGGDCRRREELQGWLDDSEVRAVFLARGGYGSSRLSGRLDLAPLRRRPKILVGYSDATVLLLHLGRETGLVTYHGPFVSDPIRDLDRLIKTLGEESLPLKVGGLRTLRAGTVRGPLTGGNLSLLTHSVGTPFEVQTDGRILFVEEVNEPLYRIDRMVRQLQLAGKFRRLKGLILGRFTRCGARNRIEGLFLEALGDRTAPAAAGCPAGHGPGNRVLPFGVPARFNAAGGELLFDRHVAATG